MRSSTLKANTAFNKVLEHSRAENLTMRDRHQGSALLQTSAPKNLMPAPIQNFAGISNPNGAFPPDTEGDVGPNYYMQWVNLSLRVFNKNGTPATPIVNGYTLFTGKPHCGISSGNGGDPIVLYDQFSDRWLASQLAYPTYPSGPFYQCVAVSQTGDPTGSWCTYEYVAHQTNLNDYPKFGVWPTQHAYMITVNQFAEPGDNWAGVGVFALERDQLINCGAARMIYKDMFPVEPNLWGGMLPADLDGSTMPPANAPAPLIEVDAQEWDPVHFPRIDSTSGTRPWTGRDPARSTSRTKGRSRRRPSTAISATSPRASRNPARRRSSTRSTTASCTGWRTATSATTRRSSSTTRSTPTVPTMPASGGTSSARPRATGRSSSRAPTSRTRR